MRSTAKERSAEGVVVPEQLRVPGHRRAWATSRRFSTSASTRTAPSSMAEAAANDVSLLDGAITIDSRRHARHRAQRRREGDRRRHDHHRGGRGRRDRPSRSTPTACTSPSRRHADGRAAAGAQPGAEPARRHDGARRRRSTRSPARRRRARSGGLLISIKSSTIEPLIAALPRRAPDARSADRSRSTRTSRSRSLRPP